MSKKTFKEKKIKSKNFFGDLVKAEGAYIASQAEGSVFDNVCFSPSPSFNYAIGGKGFAFGRIPVFYGPESCIASNSFIPYEVWSKDGKIRRNHKGGSIRRLYEIFHQDNDSVFCVKSVDDENRIIRNEVLDVVKTGKKTCHRVETEGGQSLCSTKDHKFLTKDGFLPLEKIEVGTDVFVTNETRFSVRSKIISIVEVGEMETFDLKCAYPYNNYIAEGIVVHNSGKSLMALMIIAEVQKQDPEALAIYISSEFDVEPEKAAMVGVDIDRLLIKETNVPVEIFDWIEKDVTSGIQDGKKVKVIVIDSVKAIQGPKERNLVKSDDFVIGDLSAYLPKAFKLILPTIRKNKILLILVQQVTAEMDIAKQRQGKKWSVPSGKALHHAADYYCLFEKINKKDTKLFDENKKMINDKFQQIGHRVRVKIEKNRLGPPERVGEFDIEYTKGVVNKHMEISQMAVLLGIVNKPNNRTYIYKDFKWTSKEQYETALKENVKLQAEILHEVYSRA